MNLQQITQQFVGDGTTNFGLMNRRDLYANTALTTTFLNKAMMRIQRELRCPANEKWINVAIGSYSTSFTGTISGQTLTVSAVASGSIGTSQTITAGAAAGTVIQNFVSGTPGGVGVYTVSPSQTVASPTAMTATMQYPGLTIPTDYLELIGMYPNANWVVRCKREKLERVMNYAQFATDKVLLYARQGGVWILGPAPNAGDIITIGYYAELPALVNPTDTNIISETAWDLIVYGALSEACLFYNDKRRGMQVGPRPDATTGILDGFEGEYYRILCDLNDQGARDEIDEGRVEPTHYYPDDDTDNYEIWVP